VERVVQLLQPPTRKCPIRPENVGRIGRPFLGRAAFRPIQNQTESPPFSSVACACIAYVRKLALTDLRQSLQDERGFLSSGGDIRVAPGGDIV
jgi:hypothetical protein